MDKNAVVIAFNSKATAYTFFSDVKEFQIGQSIYDFIKESRKEFFQEIIAKVLNGESIQYDRSYEMENGTTAWIDFSATPVIETGQVNGICVTGRNITEKKLMEKKILDQYVQEQKKIARAIIKAQEKERNHIGQELHDNINQILAVIKLHLDAAGKDEKLKELIKYPIELLDSTIQEIRLLSSKLVAPLKNINLKELIRLLLADLHKNTVLKTSFVYNLSGLNISDDLKLNIYRTIQEQLNNIVKHAAAKKASVSVKADKGIINIVVADDGKGFDVNKKRKGIGISNMMNRIESFNGEMAIESSPGKGCRIVIKAPY
jgi:PAS domain S-box-containing protein